jgi:putative phage-type endonuclease
MPLSDEDRALRAHGIGSSEIAAIADLDPHKGPTQVWLDKLGLLPRSENVAKWSGHKLEPVIADMYAEHTGAVLIDGGGTQVHPVHSWARATRDRCANPGPAEIVEIKNVGAWALRFWWIEGRFQAPVDKVIQAQWQLAVCGGERVHLAALLGGTDFRIFEVVRDDEMIEALFEIAERFWIDHVLARVPPDDDPEQRRTAMEALYPRSNGLLLPRTTEAEAIHARLLDIEDRENALEVDRAEAEAAALGLLGAHDGVEGLFTWRTQRGRIDWKVAAQAAGVSEKDAERYRGKPYRVLRTKKPKEKNQ